MRIDFILASPALAGRVTDAQIVREERKGKAPSDHAPVLIDVKRSPNPDGRALPLKSSAAGVRLRSG
jgi:exodeoxyribonuclease-3